MESVDIMEGNHVDERFHRVNREKVSAYIQVRATISETRLVGNICAREFHDGGFLLRNGFAQSLAAVEVAGGRSAIDGYKIGRDGKVVCFRVFALKVVAEDYCVRAWSFCYNRKLSAGEIEDVIGKQLCIAFELGVALGVCYDGCLLYTSPSPRDTR